MNEFIKYSLLSLKPKYKRESPLPPCHVIDKIQEELSAQKDVVGQTDGNDAELKLCEKDKGFWSPQLDIQVRKRGKASVINAVMVPDTRYWSLHIILMALALILLFLGVLMLVYKWVLQLDSTLGWSIPVGLLVAIFAHALGKFVQYRAKSNMDKLWIFLNEAINVREKKQRDLLNELFPDEELMI